MKRLTRYLGACLLMWLSGAVGALIWLGFFETQLGSLTGTQAVAPLMVLPLLNSGGLLLTWDLFSTIECWLIGAGMVVALAGCVVALRNVGILAVGLLLVGSAAWSIKAHAVFYGLMSI